MATCRGRIDSVSRRLERSFMTCARRAHTKRLEWGQPVAADASADEGDPTIGRVEFVWPLGEGRAYNLSYSEVGGQPLASEMVRHDASCAERAQGDP